jgi:hypothetical protein
MTPLEEAIEKIDADLKWRGPNDRQMAYVLLTRAMAEAVLSALRPTAAGMPLGGQSL